MRAESAVFPPRYRDPELVARGGMGDVFRATDADLGRPVAIKVLGHRYAADADVRERFTREALAAARLSGGPSTIKIFDVGEWQERPFIVMEYLPGGSLADVLRREGPQPLERVLEWLAQAAAALDYAHAHGVVHRDVKPANLLLDREANVHVADFGIASAAGLASLTETGTVLGTLGYLAPEQAAGRPATAAVDRYALGLVAFELLAGEGPFPAGASPTAETAALGSVTVPSISARNPSLSPRLDSVFDRALARKPEARFASCAEFVETIEAVSAGADETALAPVAHASRQRRLVWPILVGVVLAALLGLGAVSAVFMTNGHGRAASGTPSGQRPAAAPRTTPREDPLDAQARALLEAAALMRPGRCEDALALLERAAPVLGAQAGIDQLRAICSKPHGHGRGHEHGRGPGRGHEKKERD